MLRDEHDAEDVVQDSYLRALRSFAGFRGDAMRPWLLAIVRNSALTWLERRSVETHFAEFDEDVHGGAALGHGSMNDPLQALTHNEDRKRVNAALMRLPV